MSKGEVMRVVSAFESLHLRRESVNDQTRARLIGEFLAHLDPEHAYLTREDIDLLVSEFGAKAIRSLRTTGDLSAAKKCHTVYIKRVAERMAWIEQRLSQRVPQPEENVAPAPPISNWADQAAVLDQWWEHRLRNDWAKAVINGEAPNDWPHDLRQHYRTLTAHLAGKTIEQIEALFLNCFAKLYDAHSPYFSPSELDSFTKPRKDVAIGAMLKLKDNFCVFSAVIPGGGADLCGNIHADDLLLAVFSEKKERQWLAGLDLIGITQFLRGPEGSSVTVLIEHPETFRRETVTLTRNRPPLLLMRSLLYRPAERERTSPQLGVISLPQFHGKNDDGTGPGAAEAVRAALDQLESEGADGLVFDLRGNTGGFLVEAIETAGLFVGNVPVVQTKDYSGKVSVEKADQRAPTYRKPVVVLTDRSTASGAEIVAGALQNYGRAIVVGSGRTAGAGTIQTVMEMNDRSTRSSGTSGAIKLTVQRFYLPNGISTEPNGIIPDVVLPDDPFQPSPPPANMSGENSIASLPLPASAKSAKWTRLLSGVQTNHARRMSELPDMALLRRGAEIRNNRMTKDSVNLEQWREWLMNRDSETREFDKACAALKPPYVAQPSPTVELAPGTPEYDFSLYEALRILTDQIDLNKDQVEITP